MKSKYPVMLLIAFCLSYPLTGKGQAMHRHSRLAAKQVMIVLTSNWDALQGKLYAFQKHNGKWVLQFSNEVVVGSKGLGMGDGLVPLGVENAPVKHEGDKKAPAGIFTIGTAFGYADKADAIWIKNRYIRAFDTLICVDDMQSPNYNKLVDKDTVKKGQKGFEYMHRKDNYYKWGLFINHNATNTVPGDGSCIFMHIWENNQSGTDGCTAMQEQNILRVLHWINAKDRPLLVQFPVAEYRVLRKNFGLPDINFQ
jgi:L,D-peptidoglycan transpeptidase YkuD (ErfK/YbiS/YcfS/YnhG family)